MLVIIYLFFFMPMEWVERGCRTCPSTLCFTKHSLLLHYLTTWQFFISSYVRKLPIPLPSRFLCWILGLVDLSSHDVSSRALCNDEYIWKRQQHVIVYKLLSDSAMWYRHLGHQHYTSTEIWLLSFSNLFRSCIWYGYHA